MSNGAVAAAAAAAAIANAVKASGVLVNLSPEEFQKVLHRSKDGLVVVSEGGFFSKSYRYLLGYRGFAFYTKSPEPISMPAGIEIVAARQIWIPG